MFFELHDEKKIGYKKLSDADLGRQSSTHQTHIGLSEKVLTFLPNKDVISESSIFIYQGEFEYLDAYFDRIENPDGSFRSPKIRIGDNGISVVSTIRSIVASKAEDISWYLIWFGLKNGKLVFYLFNDSSKDAELFSQFGLDFDKKGTRFIDVSSSKYDKLVTYIESRINDNAFPILKDLEIKSQIDTTPTKNYRPYDIDRANAIQKRIGREGEELVKSYLERLVKDNLIRSYNWYNDQSESSLPFDFHIQDNADNISYLDVKTTGYDFDQEIVFSSQELQFVNDSKNPYHIYRVYKDSNEKYLLRICDDCQELARVVHKQTQSYSEKLKEIPVTFKTSKIALSPKMTMLSFGGVEEL